MGKEFVINYETLVRVKGNIDVDGELGLLELGLTEGPIRIVPRFSHQNVRVDDFGPDIPAEVMVMLAEVNIFMTLVHFDRDVLYSCISESLGGQSANEGTLAAAGTPLGGGKPLFDPDNHYISLSLVSSFPVTNKTWRFPTSYLSSFPLEIPLGTSRSLVSLAWRAIPYRLPIEINPEQVLGIGLILEAGVAQTGFQPGFEIVSAGAVLWDHEQDTDPNQP